MDSTRRKPGRRPRAGGPLRTIVTLKGREAFRDWLDRYRTFKDTEVSILIERALAASARRDGFEPPPERT